jgi:predicted DNA-binding protein with PD1-like motif
MNMLPLRLLPGQDLRVALQDALRQSGCAAAFVVQGIGSLDGVRLRMAGAEQVMELDGEFEILSLGGTLSLDGPHLHMAVSDVNGVVKGGHVAPGCIIRTTAEVLLALLPGQRFTREADPGTGYAELVIRNT